MRFKARSRARRFVIVSGTSLIETIRSITGYLVSWPMQELSGTVAVADNVAVAVGRDVLAPKDFTSAAWVAFSATVDDADSFSTAGQGGVAIVDGGITKQNRTYTARLKGTSTASAIAVRSADSSSTYVTLTPAGGAFDVTFTFTAGTPGLYLRNSSPGTTNFDWPNSYIKQTNILASSAYTTNNPLNGTYTGVSLAQAGQYRVPYMVEFDGATSKLTIQSAEYNSIFNPTTDFTKIIVMRKTAWDATERYVFHDFVDANNYIAVRTTTTPGQIAFDFMAGGTLEQVLYASGSPMGTLLLDVGRESDVFKARVNGVSVGSAAIAGSFVGNFTINTVGAKNTTPTNVHLGQLSYPVNYSAYIDTLTIVSAMGIPS